MKNFANTNFIRLSLKRISIVSGDKQKDNFITFLCFYFDEPIYSRARLFELIGTKGGLDEQFFR